MSTSPDSAFSHTYICHDCGSQIGFRSRRRNLVERFLLPVLFLQPVRCGECFRRDYRSIFTVVRNRLSDVSRMSPGKQAAAANRNVA